MLFGTALIGVSLLYRTHLWQNFAARQRLLGVNSTTSLAETKGRQLAAFLFAGARSHDKLAAPTCRTSPGLRSRSVSSKDGTSGARSSSLLLRGTENDHAEQRPCQVLLELDILIGRQEDFESLRGCAAQQLAVGQSSPSLLLHRTNPVAAKPPR